MGFVGNGKNIDYHSSFKKCTAADQDMACYWGLFPKHWQTHGTGKKYVVKDTREKGNEAKCEQFSIHDKCTWTILQSGQSWSEFITTDSLKVTLGISCREGKVAGFISWADWQIQYNASLRSEHFTLGPSMWPWFRWMSTSHLYSSNQQSLSETHTHTRTRALREHIDSLAHSFSLSSALSANSAHYTAETSEGKKSRDREIPDTGEIYSHTKLFTPRQQSESHWSWHQLHGALLPLLSAREVWSDRPLAPRPPGPPATLHMQCRPEVPSVPTRASKAQDGGGIKKEWAGNIKAGQNWQGMPHLASRYFPDSNCACTYKTHNM